MLTKMWQPEWMIFACNHRLEFVLFSSTVSQPCILHIEYIYIFFSSEFLFFFFFYFIYISSLLGLICCKIGSRYSIFFNIKLQSHWFVYVDWFHVKWFLRLLWLSRHRQHVFPTGNETSKRHAVQSLICVYVFECIRKVNIILHIILAAVVAAACVRQ